MKYRELEDKAIDRMNKEREVEATHLIVEKRAEVLEARKVLRRLEFEYNELMEKDIE